MGNLRVGVGRSRITPPVGAMLMGYAPARPAKAVNDELAVTAVALEHGQTRALLISADVCVIKEAQSTRFRQLISAATGVPSESTILAATHTHSGPAMRGTLGGAEIDETYISTVFEPQVVAAATRAVQSLQPARLGMATVRSEVGINRRQLEPSGEIRLGQNPWGCHDPTMTVLSFRGMDGKPIIALVHYGAHCTAAGKNPEITRDWAGPMVDRLEAESGAPAVFFNGAEGDCGPRLTNGRTTGDIRHALELGAKAAFDAVAAYHAIRDYRDVALHVLAGQVRLPYEPLPAPEVIEQQIAEMGPPEKLVGLRVMANRALCERLALSRAGGTQATHLELQQSLVAVGPVAFVPFAFEVFSEITLRLRAASPFQHTLSLSNANGSNFYFPSRDQIARGGYEVWVFKCMSPRALADNADDAAVQENLRLLNALWKSSFPQDLP